MKRNNILKGILLITLGLMVMYLGVEYSIDVTNEYALVKDAIEMFM